MKTILVSGASGIVGYGILRSLKKSGLNLKLIATTVHMDSVAQEFCDIFEQAPLTNSPEYIEWLIIIIKKHNVNLIIPGIEADLYKWVEKIDVIEKTGTKVLANNIKLINLCKDKWSFFQYLSKKNSPNVIPSSLSNDFDSIINELGPLLLLKPRQGFGSKGIIRVESSVQFQEHKDNIGSILMVQPIVGNDNEEYTTSAFCDGEGGFYAAMTLKRKLSKDGFTEKAEVVSLKEIDDALLNLCKIFKPIGPTNFQFRTHKGVMKLLEINPRVSSSTSIRTSFGYNECAMAVEYFLLNKKIKQPKIKKGRAIRYIEDLIILDKKA